jgi:hypothetical protein
MKRLFLVLFFTVVMVSSVSAQSTLALQEKCAEGARKIVSETGGCLSVHSTENYIMNCQYISHYNKKLDKCFIRFDMATIWLDSAPKQLQGKRDETVQIVDVFEHKMIGEYNSGWGLKEVGGRKCTSRTEFEALIKPYMEE